MVERVVRVDEEDLVGIAALLGVERVRAGAGDLEVAGFFTAFLEEPLFFNPFSAIAALTTEFDNPELFRELRLEGVFAGLPMATFVNLSTTTALEPVLSIPSR